MAVTPIIHCLLEREPKSFHIGDLKDQTLTFSVNLAFEAQSNGADTLENDEAAGEDLFRQFCAGLETVEFFYYQLDEGTGEFFEHRKLAEQVSEPLIDTDAFFAWLVERRKQTGVKRFWTTLAQADPEAAIEAERADAFIHSRAVSSWNAPIGHRIGFTHLVRFLSHGDGLMVVLPHFNNPNDYTKYLGQVGTDAHQVEYCPDETKAQWVCQTILFEPWRTTFDPLDPPMPKPADAIIDPDIDTNGFLDLNPEAEKLARFLDRFDARTSSLFAANAGLHPASDDLSNLEGLIGISNSGTAQEPIYDWGKASWYVMARLVSALDSPIIALRQPGQPREVGGAVLAPLALCILDALDRRREAVEGIFDYEPWHIYAAIREVLDTSSALLNDGVTDELLSRSVQHIFGIEPALRDGARYVVADQPDAALLPLLVAAYNENANGIVPAEAKTFVGGILKRAAAEADQAEAARHPAAAILTVGLADLEQQLQDEAGAERTLLRIFETLEFRQDGGAPQPADRFEAKLTALLPNQPAPGTLAHVALLDGVREGWQDYRALLAGPYNGSEAIRRAAGSAAMAALLDAAQKPLVVDDLKQLVEQANYHVHRFEGGGGQCFDVIANALVVPKGRPTLPKFTDTLEESYKSAAVSGQGAVERFIPDRFPQPLPVQIASGIDGQSLDSFARAFNGICVAVRRVDQDDSRWAYANLTDLAIRSAEPIPEALHPVMPAVTDGRGTMFLNYEGTPFADQPDLDSLDQGAKFIRATPFYRVAPHAPNGEEFELLPRLAYGRVFESFSFVATNAGTIPLALQLDPKTTPWMPVGRIEPLMNGGLDHDGVPWQPPETLPYPYRRRTAISQMAIEETGYQGQAGRVGRDIAGVHPLSKDYPRLGIVAEPGMPGTLDLFRDSDGLGQMTLPEGMTSGLSWSLTDLIASAPTGTLTIRVFDRLAECPGDHGLKEFIIPQGIAGKASLELAISDVETAAGRIRRLVLHSSDADDLEEELEIGASFAERLCWIRVMVETAGDKAVSLSLVDPGGPRPGGQGTPLLLLAPDAGSSWAEDLSLAVETVVQTPRVVQADFTRWMANADLAREAYGADGQETGKGAQFALVLSIASRVRHLSPRLAQYLDSLPDPAVAQIVIELQATDDIRGVTRTPDTQRYVAPKLKDWLDDIDFDWLDDIDFAQRKKMTTEELLDKLLGIFERLDSFFTFAIKMRPGRELRLSPPGEAYVAEVPAGCVARLGMYALVPDRHFERQGSHPSVIDADLLQYAVRQMGTYAAFDAGARQIETMYDGMAALADNDNTIAARLAAELISVRQVPATRRYDLVSANAAPENLYPDWRLISEIDITTQRWRASGRPIYHYIAPRRYAAPNSGAGVHPCLPLAPIEGSAESVSSKIDQFEREAFFDRPDVDAHTVTHRLDPMPASTVLQSFPWDSPSATYFRHRFTLRSRYAGALKLFRTSAAWRTEKKHLPTLSHVWTMRVAMLADRSRLTLTRPQLRGLIPLTATPTGDLDRQPAPPVAAVLQEPPFARGGLADRIASEIRTGFGYGFDAPAPEGDEADPMDVEPVKIQDSRKEIGPNPQLDYRPFPANRALAMAVQSEGPLGLTFDAVESSSPALANSMILLRPIPLDGEEAPPLQEALTGLLMRRYIDPEWLSGAPYLVGEVAAERPLPDASRCWWIELDDQGGELSYTVPQTPRATPVVKIERDGESIVVKVWKGPIDSGVGKEDEPIEIGRFQASRDARPKLLHQQTTPGNFLVSVLIEQGSSRTEDGEPNVPVVLCSFEWSLPRKKWTDADTPEVPAVVTLRVANSGNSIAIWETMASNTTALRWTQINRDFDFVNVLDLKHDRPKAAPIRAERLRANISDRDLVGFHTEGNNQKTRLCRSTTGNPYPTHLHRHLAMISSSFLGELGRSVETFSRAALSVGLQPQFPVKAKGPEHALRVIEFETPASIVCAADVPAPPAYRSAYFDLIKSGYANEQALLLTMRFVGSREHLKKFSKVTLELAQRDEETLTRVEQQIDVASCPIALHAHIDKGKVRSWVVYEDTSGPVILDDANLVLKPALAPGFFLKIVTPFTAGAEFWTDVSLLHGPIVTGMLGEEPDPRAIGFDFNWLFSPEADGDAATLVSSRGLSGMVEAQARIVSVSPPIPLSIN